MTDIMIALVILLFILVIGGGLIFAGWLFGDSDGGDALAKLIYTKADVLGENAKCERELKRSNQQLKEKEWERANREL